MPNENHRRGRSVAACLSVAAVCASAGLARAHDEDWRKLKDKMASFVGPIVSGLANLEMDIFDSQGVELLAWIPINNFPGTHGAGNDCWGYTSPSGREYAIMGLERGFGFVEITDPYNPVILTTITGPASTWHDVKVIGQYAYGVSEGGSGIQVMDLSNIDNGQVTLVRNSQTGGHSTTHNIVANEDAGTLWLVGANIGNGGLIHVDISNPALPQVGNGWTQMYVHDAQVVSYDSGPFAGREIAFVASGFNGGFNTTGLRIVDVTNKSNMFTVATVLYPSAAYSHQVWLSPDKRYAYLNDELDEQNGLVSTTTTRIIDVSDINNPFFAGTFTSGSPAIDHNLYTRDQYIFEANYQSGLRIFDATDPLDPVEVGYFDTFPGGDSASFNGAWSVYPYFDSGVVIVSDIERGLFILGPDVLRDRLSIDILGGAPDVLDPNGGETILANIEEVRLTLNPSTVTMHLTTTQGTQQIPGVATGTPGEFAFTTPTVPCGDPVSYYFSAGDTTGETFFDPPQGAGMPYEAIVASGGVVNFADDFETNQGWSVSGNASDGQWNRGVPVNCSRGDPASDFDGSGSAFLTDNSSASGCNSDVDGGSTILTSPAMDASGGQAYLTYARWYDNSFGSSPFADTFVVEVSNNNGTNWTTLEVVGPGGPEAAGGWVEKRFLINDVFATPSTQFRVRFTASDLGDGSVVEAAVDGVVLEVLECVDAPPPNCPADLTGSSDPNDPSFGTPDGDADGDDFFFFLDAFANSQLAVCDLTGSSDPNDPSFGTPDSDCDGDDFFFYLDLFSQGCP
ncbi:MAG: choice-of-anchor B family protein [Phycisphaerales bacterium JB037]